MTGSPRDIIRAGRGSSSRTRRCHSRATATHDVVNDPNDVDVAFLTVTGLGILHLGDQFGLVTAQLAIELGTGRRQRRMVQRGFLERAAKSVERVENGQDVANDLLGIVSRLAFVHGAGQRPKALGESRFRGRRD